MKTLKSRGDNIPPCQTPLPTKNDLLYKFDIGMLYLLNYLLIVIWKDFIMPKHVNEIKLTIYIEATRNVPNKWRTP